MKLTTREIYGVIGCGLAALTSGSLYKLLDIWVRRRVNVNDLSPETDVLWEDMELFSLFCQLQEFRSINELYFTRAVQFADRLLYLHKQLKTNEDIQVSLDDRPRAFLYFSHCRTHLEKLCDAAKQSASAKHAVIVHKLYTAIFACLEVYIKKVVHLTESVSGK